MGELERMRWYNPKLEAFEWRKAPHNDEEAFTLLDDFPSCEMYAEAYREWRNLGASIPAALLRAGELAVEKDETGGQV